MSVTIFLFLFCRAFIIEESFLFFLRLKKYFVLFCPSFIYFALAIICILLLPLLFNSSLIVYMCYYCCLCFLS